MGNQLKYDVYPDIAESSGIGWELFKALAIIVSLTVFIVYAYTTLEYKALATTARTDLMNFVIAAKGRCPDELNRTLRNDGKSSTFSELIYLPEKGSCITVSALPEDPERPVIAILRHNRIDIELIFNFDTMEKLERNINTGAVKRW